MRQNRGSADSHIRSYRADIDGLRAVAVLSVVAFHLDRSLLPGGFLGVDIFFVISGFLITSILWKEARAGQFSLVRFYERRIRRIMPALLLMLLVCTAVASAILLPIDLVGYAKSLVATLVFSANIYFWRDSGYFSAVAEEKPLLHMWSLGVEEQFYILFPFVIYLCARYASRFTPAVIAAIIVVSYAANSLAIRNGAALPAFFLLPTRAWELAAGSLLAVRTAPAWLDRPAARQAAAMLGIALIVLAMLIGLADTFWFAPIALPAVLGAMLLIWAGRDPTWTNRLLGLGPVVFVGLISYSLYLWHWPVIVFAKYYLVRDLTPVERVGVFAVSLGLAVASWRLESYFRSRKTAIRTVLTTVASGTAMVLCASLALTVSNGLPGRFSERSARMNAVVGTHYRCPVSGYLVLGASRACVMNLPTRDPADADIALVGNSHAQMYAPLVADIARQAGYQGLLVNANTCWPTINLNVTQDCTRQAASYIHAVAALPKIKTVILAFNWDPEGEPFVDQEGRTLAISPDQAALRGISETIDTFEAAGKKVVLVGPLAVPGWNIASMVSRSLAFGRPVQGPLSESAEDFETRFSASLAAFGARKDIVFIRPDRIECTNGTCNYIVDGVPLFADNTHLAESALAHFRPMFEQALAPFLPQPRAALEPSRRSGERTAS